MDLELVNPISQAVKEHYKSVDETGSEHFIYEFIDEEPIDLIVIIFNLDDEVPHQLRIYEEKSSEEPDIKIPFEERNIAFDPISVIGRGEIDELHNITPTNNAYERDPSISNYEEVPDIAKEVWKSLGFSVIPKGDKWRP